MLADFAELDPAVIGTGPIGSGAGSSGSTRAKALDFANVFGSSEDVFLHIEVLRRSGSCGSAAGRGAGDAGH